MLWTIPVSESTPMCSFIPKMTTPPRPNEFVVTTQSRVRQGNERDGPEGDERLDSPDLGLFVNGIPMVVM